MSKYKYFGYCPESGFELFATAEEAKAYADLSLEWFRAEAGDGWGEQVDQICWGELKQEVVMTEHRPWTEEDGPVGQFDYYADYGLVNI